MKKLLAFVVAGGLLALTTGCPPAPTTEEQKAPPSGPSTHPSTPTPPAGPSTHPGTPTPPAGEKDKATPPEKDKATPPEKDKATPPAPPIPPPPAPEAKPITGKVTASKDGKITVEGKDYTIPDTAKVTIDGKPGKAAEIKADSTATITEEKGKITEVEVKTK